jgi:tetratricopeptide (TPR) repeat protein
MSRLVAVVVCALALAGCPGKRHTLGVKVPTSGDADARGRFMEAQAQFRRDGQGADEFAAIAEDYPDDPIAPYAQVYSGMAMVNTKDYAGAEKALAEIAGGAPDDPAIDKGLRAKARLYLGLARNYQGEHTLALPLLAGAEPAVEDDRERGEWLAALSVAAAVGERPLDALPHFDRWYALASPAERGFILTRVAELAAAAPPEAARAAFERLEGKGPALAILGYRVAADRDNAGDAAGAKQAREAAAPARKALGLPLAPTTGASAATGGGEPGLVGAILPQAGKSARVGALAAQGLAVATGAAGGSGGAGAAGGLTVDLRSAATADEAAAALDALAAGGALAVIGPIDGESVDAAANRANALRIPLVSLSPTPERRATGRYVFHVMHSAEQRARTLARRAIAGGVTTFAVLAPDNGYGRAVSAAFADEVAKLGGSIADRQTYPDDTKSFAALVKKIGHAWAGVFVADQADKLELIAPALAAAGQIPKPLGTKKATGGRPVLLLSTAEGLSPDYLVDAGRHTEGALLAPGFYPDDKDPAIAELIRGYAGTGAPAMVDAYAYDIARAIEAARAGGRTELAGKLDKLDYPGITGTMRFDERHLRADDGIVFTVVAEGSGFAIRAQR